MAHFGPLAPQTAPPGRGLKPKTANHYRAIIRHLINWSVDHLQLRLPENVNPASKVKPDREPAPDIRYLTLPQVEEQLYALRFKPQLQTMVAVLIYAGLRREELLWLTPEDVSLKTTSHGGCSMIRVQAKTIHFPDAPGRPGGPRFWQPKTKGNRAVPISRSLRAFLDRFNPPATTAPEPSQSFPGWFFPGPSGGWWDADNFSADLRDANREAGLRWTCLDYRHTFGSQLAQKGVSLYKVATLLGNSPEICRRHYASLVPEAMAGEVEFDDSGRRLLQESVQWRLHR